MHAENLQDLSGKDFMKQALEYGSFERYIVLQKRKGVPVIEGIYDEEMKRC